MGPDMAGAVDGVRRRDGAGKAKSMLQNLIENQGCRTGLGKGSWKVGFGASALSTIIGHSVFLR
jgi:hypothetical protein